MIYDTYGGDSMMSICYRVHSPRCSTEEHPCSAQSLPCYEDGRSSVRGYTGSGTHRNKVNVIARELSLSRESRVLWAGVRTLLQVLWCVLFLFYKHCHCAEQ
jgi:hypothetical protein